MSSCGTTRHVFLWHKKICLPVPQEGMSSSAIRRPVFWWHKKSEWSHRQIERSWIVDSTSTVEQTLNPNRGQSNQSVQSARLTVGRQVNKKIALCSIAHATHIDSHFSCATTNACSVARHTSLHGLGSAQTCTSITAMVCSVA